MKEQESEEKERERNRQDTYKRSRMWQTVGSSSSGSSSSEGEEEDRDSGDDGREERRKKRREEEGEKGKKKSKKEKKEKKEKKKKSKKRKDKKSSSRSESKAIDQNQYGCYGIIKEEHFYQKQREFEKYMEEVKHMPGIIGQGRREVMEWFRCYMEDYNTATMPHVKYYNLEAWEMKDYHEQQEAERKSRKKRSRHGSGGDGYDYVSDTEETAGYGFNDEQLVREEKKRQRELEERRQFEEMKAKIARDKVRREEMRDQEILRNELQVAYRQGDMETVKRLERRLAPDEEDGRRR